MKTIKSSIGEEKMKKKVWLGETKCDFCKKECENILIDGESKFGPWAVFCEDCHSKFGTELYQKYRKNGEEFVKTGE